MSFTIAIVGRPNVGKSALFNRIVRKRIAIVHDMPGVTRDRVMVEAQWKGRSFALIDTGGIGLRGDETSKDQIIRAAMDQVDVAIADADLILFVVSVKDGLQPLDEDVARKLRISGKTVILVVNKVDHSGLMSQADDFNSLGFDVVLSVSAAHDRGMEALCDAFLPRMESLTEITDPTPSDSPEDEQKGDGPLKLAIVGRPNVGKSSIINALTQSERVIVSEIAGTTRDSVDVPFEFLSEGNRESFILIDTAGIRKRTRVRDSIEFFSVKRAEDSIERCDLAVLVIDAEAGVTEQDKKIAGKITVEKKACVVVINKWDLVEQDVKEARKELRSQTHGRPRTTLHEFATWVQEQLFFIHYAPVVFTSAKSGFHLEKLMETVSYVYSQIRKAVPTAVLNRILRDALVKKPAIDKGGRPMKFFYATQISRIPPTFLLFMNKSGPLDEPFARYLNGVMRKAFGFEGCPIHIIAKARPKSVEGIRKFKKSGRFNPSKTPGKPLPRGRKPPKKRPSKS